MSLHCVTVDIIVHVIITATVVVFHLLQSRQQTAVTSFKSSYPFPLRLNNLLFGFCYFSRLLLFFDEFSLCIEQFPHHLSYFLLLFLLQSTKSLLAVNKPLLEGGNKFVCARLLKYQLFVRRGQNPFGLF